MRAHVWAGMGENTFFALCNFRWLMPLLPAGGVHQHRAEYGRAALSVILSEGHAPDV